MDKIGLPKIIGYILTGIVLSPHSIDFIDFETIEITHPLMEVCLAFIAFEIEDAEVIIFDKEIYLIDNLSKEDIINYTHLLYRRMGILQRRVMMLLSAPAVERYAYFLKTYPCSLANLGFPQIERYFGNPASVDSDHGKNTITGHALAKPLLACHFVS